MIKVVICTCLGKYSSTNTPEATHYLKWISLLNWYLLSIHTLHQLQCHLKYALQQTRCLSLATMSLGTSSAQKPKRETTADALKCHHMQVQVTHNCLENSSWFLDFQCQNHLIHFHQILGATIQDGSSHSPQGENKINNQACPCPLFMNSLKFKSTTNLILRELN